MSSASPQLGCVRYRVAGPDGDIPTGPGSGVTIDATDSRLTTTMGGLDALSCDEELTPQAAALLSMSSVATAAAFSLLRSAHPESLRSSALGGKSPARPCTRVRTLTYAFNW
ncbi:hypothetical protein GCM10023192_32320 [Amycolatopsis samaneae]